MFSYFPYAKVEKTDSGYEASLGLALSSILKEYLFFDASFTDDTQKVMQGNIQQKLHLSREAFLHALAFWDENITLEWHVTVHPDLAFHPQGKILFTLLLRVAGTSQDCAQETLLSKYLILKSLISAHYPEAEFEPICQESDLAKCVMPFSASHALAVHRREETLSLTSPFIRRAIGLGDWKNPPEEQHHQIRLRFPWAPSYDHWERLLRVLVNQLDPLHIIIRAQHAELSAEERKEKETIVQGCELFLKTGNEFQLTLNKQAGMIRDTVLSHLTKLSEAAYKIGVFILAPHPIDPALGNVLGDAITARQGNTDHQGFYQGSFSLTETSVNEVIRRDYYFEKESFTLTEAASAFRLPSPPFQDLPGLSIRRSRTALGFIPFSVDENRDSLLMFHNVHQDMVQPVRVSTDDRMCHAFIIGQTGTGKSTLMETMILQDIRAGRGLAVIDPHGDMIDAVLGKIPQERIDDVILFDFLDRQCPIGFNILQWRTLDERDFIIDGLYNTIDRIYDMKQVGGPIFEYNFRNMLRLLMGDEPRTDFTPTLLEFIRCYSDSEFRQWLKKRTSDGVILDFVKELEKAGGEAKLENLAPYITSKFARFTGDKTLVRIIGQEKTPFDFSDIIDNGKIFFVKLGKGRFGSVVSSLLANQLVSRFKHAVMKRGDMRPEHRRDFFLYVDEAHNLSGDNFTELLSEARKFRMGLILATQYTVQLKEKGPGGDLLSAIIGNVGTLVTFRLGQEDAQAMAPSLFPYFTALDIIGLPNWQGYSRIQMSSHSVPPFSFRSHKDDTPFDEKRADYVRSCSAERYGREAKQVDADIQNRRKILENE